MLYRHVHIYLETRTSLVPGFAQYRPSAPASYKKQETIDEWLRKWDEESAPHLLHCLLLERLEAVIFDFESNERESLYACPGPEDRYSAVSLVRQPRRPVAFMFLAALDQIVRPRGFSSLDADRVSYRSSKGSFDRHLIRVEAMKAKQGLVFDKIEPMLLLKLSSFDWNSVLGPESHGNSEILARQMGAWDPRADSVQEDEVVKGRLQTTLNIFERIRACLPVKV